MDECQLTQARPQGATAAGELRTGASRARSTAAGPRVHARKAAARSVGPARVRRRRYSRAADGVDAGGGGPHGEETPNRSQRRLVGFFVHWFSYQHRFVQYDPAPTGYGLQVYRSRDFFLHGRRGEAPYRMVLCRE